MKREEAIDILRSYLMFDKSNMQIDIALNMAIEALQSLSKPNNGLQGSDLIRREDIPYVDLNSDMPHSNVRVWIAFKESIDALPSAEAVEVVRCKDCYHAEDDITHMYCVYFCHKVYGEDYCSNAVERRGCL